MSSQTTGEDLADEPAAAYGPQAGMSVSQIVAILRAYWRQSAMIACAIIVLAAVGIKLLAKTYTATATLIVNRANADPLATERLPTDINYVVTQMELMTSPVILLPVVDRLNLTSDKQFVAGFKGDGANALRDYAERALFKRVETDTGRGGQLIYVTAEGHYPNEAAALANAVADVYMDEARQRLTGPAVERAQRYSQELAELRSKAEAAQQSLTDFRQRNALTNLNESATDGETQALTTLEARLLDAQNQRRALEARRTGEEATADEALSSEQVGHLRTQLATLHEQQADLSTTLGPRHPKLLAVEAQITATQAALNRAISALSANTDTDLSRARDLETRLSRAVDDERAKVLKLRQLQDEGQKLQLELESAQSVYKRALDGYDQIMFASVDHSADVSLISRATPPVQPSKPNKVKLLLGGVLVGLLLGLSLPLAYELLMNRRLRCRDDLERSFGIPVLAQFDAIAPATTSV